MAQFLTPIFLQMADSSNNPLVGAKLHIYAPSTTTPLSLYSNEALSTPTANPIIADASGVFAGCFMAETSFKAVMTTSADVVLYTKDPVYSIGQADNVSAANVSYDGTALGFSSTNLQDAIAELAASFILAPPTTVDNTVARFNGVDGQLQTTGLVVDDSNNLTGIAQITQTSTGANVIPKGTTGQRPGSPVAGMLRYNSTNVKLEYYDTDWRSALTETSYPSVMIYTGSTQDNLDFPVGTCLWVAASSANRNASHAIYLAGTNGFSTSVSGTALTGTWRARGARIDGTVSHALFQRVA